MSSKASRAARKVKTLIERGESPQTAMDKALQTYPAKTVEYDSDIYARFGDKSYMRLLLGRGSNGLPQVLSHHTSQFKAEKIIEGIHAYCDKCGVELWCNMEGDAAPDECFQFPGANIYVCKKCQREIVERSLLGE